MKTPINIMTLVALWLIAAGAPLAFGQDVNVPTAPEAAPEQAVIAAPEAAPPIIVEEAAAETAPAETAAEAVQADAAAEEAYAQEVAADQAATDQAAAEQAAADDGAAMETAPVIEVQAEREAEGIEVTQSPTESNKISVTLDNVPLQDVVRMFTRISGANIVSGTNLSGSVTVNLQDVEWEPALRVILDSTGHALLEKTPGIFTIVSKSELASEPVTSDTIFLSYVTVSNILPLVKSMIVSSNGGAVGFAGANAIIVQETVPRIKVIRDVVSRLDKPRDQVLIETKFVELNDEAIKDLGINWQVLEGYTMSVTPRFEYLKRSEDVDSDQDTSSDRTLRTIQNRRSRNDVDESRDVVQDANLSFENATDSTTFLDPPGSSTFTESLVDSDINVSGENFDEFDPDKGTLVLIPRRDHTVTDTALNDDNRIRTLDDLISSGSDLSETTTKALSAILSAEQFSLTLSALKQNNGVEVVSNPKIVVASGETAKIHVGRNEPNIVAVPQGDTGDRFAYTLDQDMPFIEIGVKLEVTPTLNTESNINVRITPELSRKLSDKLVGEAGTTFPVTQIRKIITEFNLESGRTVAIGGLTETDDVENIVKVPVLGDIPIIGKYLFRHTHTEKVQDEVIIFVTVTSAKPNTLAQISGIPEEGRLIHRHLAQRAEEAAKAEQMKARNTGKKTAPSLR